MKLPPVDLEFLFASVSMPFIDKAMKAAEIVAGVEGVRRVYKQLHAKHWRPFCRPGRDAIIASQVPETLTLEALKRHFPVAWEAQRKHFGIR